MGSELLPVSGLGVSPLTYVLLPDGTVRRPIDVQDWTYWTRMGREVFGWYQVAETVLDGRIRISTAFLMIDHDHGLKLTVRPGGNRRAFDDWEFVQPVGYRPVVFETMVFGGPLDGDQYRYRSYKGAKAGHARAVRDVKIALIRREGGECIR